MRYSSQYRYRIEVSGVRHVFSAFDFSQQWNSGIYWAKRAKGHQNWPESDILYLHFTRCLSVRSWWWECVGEALAPPVERELNQPVYHVERLWKRWFVWPFQLQSWLLAAFGLLQGETGTANRTIIFTPATFPPTDALWRQTHESYLYPAGFAL